MLRLARSRPSGPLARPVRRAPNISLEALECRRVLTLAVTTPLAAATPGDWTVMVYITATDLYDNAPGNIEAMERLVARLPSTVKVVVEYDQFANRNTAGKPYGKLAATATTTYATGDGTQPAWSTAGIGVIQGDAHAAELDQKDEPIAAVEPRIATSFAISPTEVDTGQAATLADFVVEAAQLAPARHYALILWDHGGGVDSLNNDTYDTLPNSELTMSKVVAALQDDRARGVSLDLLAYDECLMATIEGAYEVGDLAPVTVASEELIAGPGYNYNTALGVLATNPAQVDAAALASSMVTSFGARYGGKGSDTDTLSAVTAAGVQGVAAALKTFVASNQGAQPKDWAAIAAARAGSPEFGTDGDDSSRFYDLGSFMNRLAASNASPTIRAAASAVAQAVNAAVIARTDDKRGARGESIYFPGSKDQMSAAYAAQASRFLDATGWDHFLDRFAATSTGRNPARSVGWSDNHDGPASALKLGTQVGSTPRVPGLVLPGGGQDWYEFTTLATGRARDVVRVAGPAAGQMILTVQNSADGSTVARGRGAVRLGGLPAGDYLLSVTRARPGPATPYTLRVVAPSATVNVPPANDNQADAEDLGTIAHARLAGGLNLATPRGAAWFRFDTPRSDVPAHGAATVLTRSGPLTATLYSEDLVPLKTVRGTQALRLAYRDTGGADSYWIRVTGRPGAYSIYFTDPRAARG